MIIDVTGIILMPGNQGQDCPGNGDNPAIECCCDECDYMLCCFDTDYPGRCNICKDRYCPRARINQAEKLLNCNGFSDLNYAE